MKEYMEVPVHGFFVPDALMMFGSLLASLVLASFNAARLPTPLPSPIEPRMLLKLPLTGGIIFCGLLMLVFELMFYTAVCCFPQPAQLRLKIRSAFSLCGD